LEQAEKITWRGNPAAAVHVLINESVESLPVIWFRRPIEDQQQRVLKMANTVDTPRRIYTTAPESMDLRGTVMRLHKAGVTASGHDIRMVEIPEDLFTKQVKMYVSSLYAVMDEQEWRSEQQFGNVTPLYDSLAHQA